MASGISMQPFPGSVGTSGHLVETLTTSPSLANQPELPASATRSEVSNVEPGSQSAIAQTVFLEF